MYRTKAIRLNKLDLRILRNNSTFLILLLILIIGVAAGAFAVGKNAVLLEKVQTDAAAYIAARKTGTLWQMFINSVMWILPYPLLCFVCGTSVVGCALSPLIVAYRGFFYGAVSGYLYSAYALKGVAFNALILIPCTLVAFFGLLLSARESLGFSSVLAGMCVKGGKSANLYVDFKNYCGRHLVILITVLLSVLLDLGMSSLFIKFFDF